MARFHYAADVPDDIAFGMECALPAALWETPDERPAARGGMTPLRRLRQRAYLVVTLALLGFGLLQFGHGAYIHAKAHLAQVLLRHAWSRTLHGTAVAKPWPWADTWPVARLVVPAQKEELLVLAGANGRTIAFGPGHMFGTPLPGESGNSVIGAHRDTHFSFLQKAKCGDMLIVERADGVRRTYRVERTEIVDKSDRRVGRQDGTDRLTLVTCYPFNALRAGGPLRYVVSARAVDRPRAPL